MSILDFLKKEDILKKVNEKNKIIRLVIYIIMCASTALCYNLFFVKNNLVIGGIGGLAIILKDLFGINTSIITAISTIFLLFLSFVLIGKSETQKNAFSAIAYLLFVIITEPIALKINIVFESYLFTVLIASIIHGISLGIIYKVGYSTGGGDIINQIICKYAKTSIGQASNYINFLVIFTAAFIFGLPKTIYALFSLMIVNTIIDFVVLGNSDSKLCIIKTKNVEYLCDFLQNDFNVGYSILSATGGTERKTKKTIMCVVTSREYYKFKNLVLDIDPTAFFVTHDCYEVLGGKSKRILN